MELLREGRPGLLDVVAEIGDRLAHVVFALHRTGEELRLLGTVEEPALGVIEDADGFAVVVDAVHDLDASQLLLDAVAGRGCAGARTRSSPSSTTEPKRRRSVSTAASPSPCSHGSATGRTPGWHSSPG